ncbi:hypothetical protein GCM10019998_05760 [Tetragenococcus solitarius]|uniref:Uncharacterized protein n=1 Tax=Tetragenococcus solitarius TaxID=71453 RepID=A0ABN3Y0M1_9ENTE
MKNAKRCLNNKWMINFSVKKEVTFLIEINFTIEKFLNSLPRFYRKKECANSSFSSKRLLKNCG